MNDAEKLAVMQAHKIGEPIQFRYHGEDDDHWFLTYNPAWQWDRKDYRVQPDSEQLIK